MIHLYATAATAVNSVAMPLMEWAKFGASLATPFVALIGAVWLFFLKAKQERDTELRRERLDIYREYLGILQSHQATDYRDYASAGIALIGKISALHDKIALMAPDEVAKASLVFINSNVGDHLYKDGRAIPTSLTPDSDMSASIHLQAGERLRTARYALLTEMRKDIVKGTKVDPTLTAVEDLEK